MSPIRIVRVIAAAGLLAGPAFAQSGSPPLNLKLPPTSGVNAAPAASSSAAAKPTASDAAPGVYYGDTSGSTDAGLAADDDADTCDDATYNKPQVHGSVGMGVVAGNHLNGNYQTGTVRLSKAFGDCDHPTGGVSISIGTDEGRFHSDRLGRGR